MYPVKEPSVYFDLKACCNTLFTHAFDALNCVLEVITLALSKVL